MWLCFQWQNLYLWMDFYTVFRIFALFPASLEIYNFGERALFWGNLMGKSEFLVNSWKKYFSYNFFSKKLWSPMEQIWMVYWLSEFHRSGFKRSVRDLLQVTWQCDHPVTRGATPQIGSNFGRNSNGPQNLGVLVEIFGVYNLSSQQCLTMTPTTDTLSPQ